MAKITLTINGNILDVQQKISIIKTDLKSIGAQPIKITVDASGLDAVSKKTVSIINAQARLTRAENELAIQREKTATAIQNRLAAEARVQAQMEKTATAEEQARVANTNLQTQIERTNTTRAQEAVQAERTATAIANLAVQQERTATANAQEAVQAERTNTVLAQTTLQQERNAVATRSAGDAAEYAARRHSLLHDILSRIQWRIINASISYVAKALRDATTEMKAVDAELTNIRKVSGLTIAEIERLGDAAYSTASKYGVAAESYLSAVYTFQKAGLGDSAEKLGELATKTMLVGDTTADVASKFLIAVNAAWDLRGSYEDLNRVVDEADYINNNYATDLEKLSAGMPIVASTAANMNMSIEETLAVLGTITAKTQETGTKAATAWRALAMNIAGEIGTITDETGESIEVTEAGVKSISDALKIYGNEAVKTAQATGQVIDPMEAVISLAEAYKDGLLTDIELENILMEVGGKLRTNQLTALVKDLASETSTYYDILSKLPEAAGTADAEIAVMLDSWNAKTTRLKNFWTEFVESLTNTHFLKNVVDSTGYGLDDLAWALRGEDVPDDLSVRAFKQATEALREYEKALGDDEAVQKWMDSNEKQLAVLANLVREYEAAGTVIPLRWYDLASAIEAIIDPAAAAKDVLRALREDANETLGNTLQNANSLLFAVQNGFADWTDELGKMVEGIVNARDNLAYTDDEFSSLTDEERANWLAAQVLIAAYAALGYEVPKSTRAVEAETAATEDNTDATEDNATAHDALAVVLKSEAEIFSELKEKIDPLTAALDEMNDKGAMTDRTMQALVEAYPDLADAITLTKAGWVVSTQALKDHLKALEANYQEAFNNAQSAAATVVNAEELKKAGFDATTMSIKEQLKAMMALYSAKASAARADALEQYGNDAIGRKLAQGAGDKYFKAVTAAQNALSSLGNAESNFATVQGLLDKLGNRADGSKKSSSSSSKDPELEALKDAVTLEKQRLSLLEASNASDDERIAKMHDIQSALHDQAEYLRSIGASEADIKALSTEWWTIQSKIAKVYDDAAEAAKNLREEQEQAARDAFYDYVDAVTAALDAERDKQVDVLQAQLDKLTAQHDAVEEQRQEQEKLLAVEKARIALQNAKNQRTVRQYNHATNQWEWVANAKTVEDAEKAFADAQATLTEYRENRLYEQQKKAIEDQIDATKTAFDAQKKAWEDAVGAVRAGTLSVQDALKNGASDITSASAQVQTALQNLLATLNTAVQTAQAQKTPNGAFATTASGQTIAAPSGSDIAIYADNGSYKTYDSNGNWTGGGGNSASYHFDPSAATRTDYSGADPTKYYDVNGNVTGTRPGYDSGGVLHGLGGIKATREDELILPPDLTKTVIRPALDGATARALDNMRVVYGMKPAQSMTLAYGNTYADSGTHIETQYVVNGMTISQDSAKYLTVEAAMRFLRSANNLPLYYRS